MLNPTCQPGSTATRWNPHRLCSSVGLLMHGLKRRSRCHKYENHMPLCHVALCICSLMHDICLCSLTKPRYWRSDRLCSSGSFASRLASWSGSIQFPRWRSFYLVSSHFYAFWHSFPLLDASHCVPTVDSYQWGLPPSSGPSALFIEAEKTRRKM